MLRHSVPVLTLFVALSTGLACQLPTTSVNPAAPAAPTASTTSPDPSPDTPGRFAGRWSSTTSSIATATAADACHGLTFEITTQTPTEISGTFALTCLVPPGEDASIAGTITGTLTSETTGTIVITGDGSSPTHGTCALTASSDLSLDGDLIHGTFSGSACGEGAAGTFSLRKDDLSGLF
jgi:hypothetical protein